jgi:Trk-type K+ transport system membrane component/enoyl-CoA hydratase/carnithine racemase
MTAQLLSTSEGQTLILTLSNPEFRNALGPEMYAAGVEALSVAESSADVRSVVITGANGIFSAGGNLQRLQNNRQLPPEHQAQSIEGLHNWIEAIRTFPKPVIAAVEGPAAGAGFSLALACDMIVAARNSVFVMAYSSIALSPDGGGSWSLSRAVPRQLATELLMCGERISAERLQQLGVVNRLADAGQALQQALALCEQLNARAPNALASIKELLIFMFVVQGYFLVFVALELGKASRLLPHLKLSPPALLVLSFGFITVLGAVLLMMPEMSTTSGGLSSMDAFFTSVSAVCVTGLSTIDISTVLTFKGQVVLLILIQLGGLNFITFASVFALLANSGVGTRYKSMLQSNYSVDSLESSVLLTGQIIRFSLLFELISAILLFFSWGQRMFSNVGEQLFHSIFHSVSAFNNAGFALYSGGLADAAIGTNIPLGLVIAFTIIFGGLGFSPISEVFSVQSRAHRRSRPWLHYSVNTKIAVYAVLLLIPFGTLAFYALEIRGVLHGMDPLVQFYHSFFSSVTTRTAGFNTIDFGGVGLPTLLVVIFLMFIGGSSGSTAGGVKTSTFTLVFLNALATIRGKKRVELFRQTISVELLNLALSAFLFSISVIALGIFALTVTDSQFGLARIAFEEVSAFCTVGLSTGITAQFSDAGKIILMISMLIGRIGTITLAFALTRKRKDSQDYRYPNARVQVG